MDIESRLTKLENDVEIMKDYLKQIASSLQHNQKVPTAAVLAPAPKARNQQPKIPTTPILVNCVLCKREVEKNKVYDVKSSGQTTYECVDSKECSKEVARVNEELRRNRLSEFERNYEDNYDDLVNKYGSLEKEEQLKMMFNIEFEDLIELPRFRDACIHYKHKDSDQKYTWSLVNKHWSLRK
jgi:hypothetical protein